DVLFGPARLPHAAAVPGGGNDDRGCVVDVRLETHLFTIRASRPNTCRGPRRHAWPRAAAPRPAVPAGPPARRARRRRLTVHAPWAWAWRKSCARPRSATRW